MKKLFVLFFALAVVSAFGAVDKYVWRETDIDKMQSYINNEENPKYLRIAYGITILHLTDRDKVDTFDKYKQEMTALFKQYGMTNPDEIIANIALITRSLENWFGDYIDDVILLLEDNKFKLDYIISKHIQFDTPQERWQAIGDCLIDYNYGAKKSCEAVNLMFTLDGRVKREVRKEMYQLIYEKLYANIGDTNADNAAIWKKTVASLAMKLKALGVDIK